MTQLTREDVLKLAQLARLNLTDEEVESYRQQLSQILDYVAQLDAVDTAGLEATTQVTGLKNVLRDDQVIDYGMSSEELLKLAPATKDNHVKVKRMIQ